MRDRFSFSVQSFQLLNCWLELLIVYWRNFEYLETNSIIVRPFSQMAEFWRIQQESSTCTWNFTHAQDRIMPWDDDHSGVLAVKMK